MPPRTNRIFTRSLLGIVLVMFLLPFSTVTCSGAKLITMNGVQLVTGTTIENKDPFTGRIKTEKIKPEPLAAVAGIVAIIALGLAFVGGKVGKVITAVASAAGAVALLMLKAKVDQDAIRQGQGLMNVQWEFGFWLALLALIAAAVVSFIPDKAPASETSA
jgi:hypothetical protein